MPKLPTALQYNATATPRGVDILNAIRAEASSQYQQRVPIATQDNIQEVGNPIMNFETTRNEFLTALVNRIAMVLITNKSYSNPLKRFKKGLISVGETVEEIFVDIIKAEPYYMVDTEGKTDCEDLFARRLPNVLAAFHKRNRRDKYAITIENDDLRTAFISYSGVEDLVSKIITALYTSDELDEFILMKHMFLEAGQRGAIKAVTIPNPADEATAKQAITAIRATALKLTFMSRDYNMMGVATYTDTSDQIIFLSPDFAALTDVEVLASAFNMDKAQFIGSRIIVDDFGGLEKLGVKALVVDADWFMIFDNYYNMTEQYNAARLYWNYFLHHWQTLSFSPFKNAVAYVTEQPTITAVTVTPATASTAAGTATELQFNANVTGTGMFSPLVTWSIPVTAGVTVDEFGKVSIDATAAAGTVTITATSKMDPTKAGTATLTITA